MKKNLLLHYFIFLHFSYLSAQTIVKDIYPGINASSPSIVGLLDSGFLMYATTPTSGTELWYSDGTASGSKQLKDINIGTGSGNTNSRNIVIGSTMYFIAREAGLIWSLWKTDGSSNGTVKIFNLGSIPLNANFTFQFAAHKNNLYFAFEGLFSGTGAELWISDGTSNGTVLLKDINPSGASDPSGFVSYGDYIYFFANDGSHGNELWRSDGTENGTTLVKDIFNGGVGSYTYPAPSLMVFKDKLYFGAQGTHDEGVELYVSDGTANGTELLMDINPGQTASSFPALLISNSDFLFFRANDGSNGTEPWITDGTKTGTKMLKDIYSGSTSSTPYSAALINNKIVFNAESIATGSELWITDGTSNGTTMLKDIFPGSSSSYPSNKTFFDNRLFFSADDSISGLELWETDGTPFGTKLNTDINIGRNGSGLFGIWIFNNDMYFSAKMDSDSAGNELYRFHPAKASSIPTEHSNNFQVFPNPVQSGACVFIPKMESQTEYLLLASDGRIVMRWTPSVEAIVLKIPEGTAKGLYYLLSNSNKSSVQYKLLIE